MTGTEAITVSSLSKRYLLNQSIFKKKKYIQALDDVTFSLREGDTLGILGESGAGKSTLAKILVGAESPTEGQILIDSKDVTELTARQRLNRHRKVRMVYQNPYASLNPATTIYSQLEEPLRNITSLGKIERKELIIETLNLVGLKSEHGLRYPHMFSAGERQRIAIARALILDPVCIILDEPISTLDISVQSQIVNLMLELQKNLELSYILITYNLPVLKHMCDQLLVLCDGQMVEYGPAKSILENPFHPYTSDILNKKSKSHDRSQHNKISSKGCIYCDRCEDANEKCFQNKPQLKQVEDRLVRCHKDFEQPK